MRAILLLTAGIFLLSNVVNAQSGPDAAINATVQLALTAVFGVQESSDISKDRIEGSCTYEKGCGGALVRLLDSMGKPIESQTILAAGTFAFPSLKPGRYRIEISSSRYKLAPVSKEVATGSFVSIDLEPRQAKSISH